MKEKPILNDCLKKLGLNVRQARRMVYNRIEWQEFVRGECYECSPGDEPLTLTRCYSSGLSPLYESLMVEGLYVAKPAT